MRIKQLFLTLALLCTVVQGAWAQDYDVWDGHSESKPNFQPGTNNVQITSGAELNWLHEHWDDYFTVSIYANFYVRDCNIDLMRDST